MNIVAKTKKETDIRSKASPDPIWNIRKIEANKYVTITGQEKYGIYTFYVIGENEYIYGNDVQIIRDKEFYYKEYPTKKLIKAKSKNIDSGNKRGLSYHTEVAKDNTELFDELQKFNTFSTYGGSSNTRIIPPFIGESGGFGDTGTDVDDSDSGSFGGSYNDGFNDQPDYGNTNITDVANQFGLNTGNEMIGRALEGVTINSLFDGTGFETILGNLLNGLFDWLGIKLEYVIGFNFGCGFTKSTRFNREWNYVRPRFDSGGSANTEQITQRQITNARLTAKMINYFKYWDYIGDLSEDYNMMHIPTSYYLRTITSFYPQGSGRASYNNLQYNSPPNLSNGYGVKNKAQFFSELVNDDRNDFIKQLDVVDKDLNIHIDYNETVKNFNRFKYVTLDNLLTSSRSHIFFTRPDLNLNMDKQVAGGSIDTSTSVVNSGVGGRIRYAHATPLVANLQAAHPLLMGYLTADNVSDHQFIPKFTDCCTGIDIADEVLETKEIYESFTGWKLSYGTSTLKSKTSGSVTINFRDDKYLSIYKMIKVWTEYINAVYRGEVSPKSKWLDTSVIDYAISIYYFLTDITDENIIFYTKFTGCFPTGCPSSSYSDDGNFIANPTYNVPFFYTKKDDYNPINIVEFNKLSSQDYKAVNIYNPDTGMVTRSFVGAPFVDTIDGGKIYKLRFRANPDSN